MEIGGDGLSRPRAPILALPGSPAPQGRPSARSDQERPKGGIGHAAHSASVWRKPPGAPRNSSLKGPRFTTPRPRAHQAQGGRPTRSRPGSRAHGSRPAPCRPMSIRPGRPFQSGIAPGALPCWRAPVGPFHPPSRPLAIAILLRRPSALDRGTRHRARGKIAGIPSGPRDVRRERAPRPRGARLRPHVIRWAWPWVARGPGMAEGGSAAGPRPLPRGCTRSIDPPRLRDPPVARPAAGPRPRSTVSSVPPPTSFPPARESGLGQGGPAPHGPQARKRTGGDGLFAGCHGRRIAARSGEQRLDRPRAAFVQRGPPAPAKALGRRRFQGLDPAGPALPSAARQRGFFQQIRGTPPPEKAIPIGPGSKPVAPLSPRAQRPSGARGGVRAFGRATAASGFQGPRSMIISTPDCPLDGTPRAGRIMKIPPGVQKGIGEVRHTSYRPTAHMGPP